jgi:hypothetical protein
MSERRDSVGQPERQNLENLGVDWRIILKCILKKYNGNVRNGFSWLRIG